MSTHTSSRNLPAVRREIARVEDAGGNATYRITHVTSSRGAGRVNDPPPPRPPTNRRSTPAPPPPRRGNRWRTGFLCLLGIVLIGAIVAAIVYTVTSNKAGASPDASGQLQQGQCYRVQNDPNVNSNYVSHLDNSDPNSPVIHNRGEDWASVIGDARILAARLAHLGLTQNPYDTQSLVNGDCLSETGIKLANEAHSLMFLTAGNVDQSKSFVDENAQAPTNLCNSGMRQDGVFVSTSCGLTGKLDAIHYVIAFTDGTPTIDFYVLKRCGNLTFPAPLEQYHQGEVPVPSPVCTGNCGQVIVPPPAIVPPPVVIENCLTNPSLPGCQPPPVCNDCTCQSNCPPPVCNDCTCQNCPPPCNDCTCQGVPCPKDPADTLTGENAPGQNGHMNANPNSPGEKREPSQMTTPQAAPRQNPTTRPSPTLAPDVKPLPSAINTPAPDPGVVVSPGSPGSSEGRSDGVVAQPSSWTAKQSEFTLAG